MLYQSGNRCQLQNFNNLDTEISAINGIMDTEQNIETMCNAIPKQANIAIDKYPTAIINGAYFTIILHKLNSNLDISSIPFIYWNICPWSKPSKISNSCHSIFISWQK